MPNPDPIRQLRSLRSCHLPSEPKALSPVRATREYIPELSARLERDPNLCDGARRCARVLAGYIYRRDRESRTSEITVSYLSRGLGRCRRTVQRYLRQLERAGYIESDVIASCRSRLCVGMRIRLLRPLLPEHRVKNWPDQLVKSGVTSLSQNHRYKFKHRLIPVRLWACQCMDGVFRSLIKTLPPLPQAL